MRLEPTKVLVVSPHLDDAALSLGAAIAAWNDAGVSLHVITIFAGMPDAPLSPVAHNFHGSCGLGDDAMLRRRQEDILAMDTLGAHGQHLGFLDAIYRVRDDGSWLCGHDRAMFTPMSPDEALLASSVEQAIMQSCQQLNPDLMATCAAFGGHIDHRLTRSAVTAVATTAVMPLMLWEDVPYQIGASSSAVTGRPVPRHAPPAAWVRKWSAITAYESQVDMLWPDGCDWRAQLAGHARERGGGELAELTWVIGRDL